MHEPAVRTRFIKVLLLLSGTLILLLGISLLVYFFISRNIRRNHEFFIQYASSAELCLTTGNGADAYDDLLRAVSYASTRSEWYRVLGLCYRVSEEISDPGMFCTAALGAAADLPGNEDFWAFAVHGLLLNGKTEEAYKLAEKRLRSERYAGLLIEAALRLKKKPIPDHIRMSADDRTAILLAAGSSNDDPVVFLTAGERTGEKRFFADAALCLARKENLTEAFSVFRTHFPPENSGNAPERMNELGSRLAFDTKNSGMSLQYLGGIEGILSGNETSLLLAGDIFMKTGKYFEAERAYEKIISLNPDFSWIPYLNTAWLERYAGNVSVASKILIDGLSCFKDDIRLSASYARLLYSTGSDSEADAFLNAYTTRFPGNDDARLVKLKLSKEAFLPERFEAELWDLYYDHPESEETIRFLGWYLLGKGDMHGLEQLFKSIPERFSSSVAVSYYKALYDGARGDIREALDGFNGVLEKTRSWDAYYNRGILLGRLDMWKDAESSFSESLKRYHLDARARENDPKAFDVMRARILSALASTYGAQKKFGDMELTAETALKLDPGNIEANTLLKTARERPENETKKKR